jgi:GAF domain-containing protein
MFKLEPIKKMNEEERLKYMNILLKGQLSSEKDNLANISNATAIINACIDNINWAGFYFLKEDELVLGPFQGLPACNRIAVGKGVCGTAVSTREVQLVPDVHLFPGHIACDSASNSEIVIPIIKDDKVIGWI